MRRSVFYCFFRRIDKFIRVRINRRLSIKTVRVYFNVVEKSKDGHPVVFKDGHKIRELKSSGSFFFVFIFYRIQFVYVRTDAKIGLYNTIFVFYNRIIKLDVVVVGTRTKIIRLCVRRNIVGDTVAFFFFFFFHGNKIYCTGNTNRDERRKRCKNVITRDGQ